MVHVIIGITAMLLLVEADTLTHTKRITQAMAASKQHATSPSGRDTPFLIGSRTGVLSWIF